MKKAKRLMALLLTLALALSFIPVNIAKADMSLRVTFNGPWEVGEESVSADKNGEVLLGFDDEISLTGFNSETMEAVLTGPNNFEATLIVDEEGKTSISTASVDSFPVNMNFIVRAKNSGGGNNNEAKIVFRGVDSFELYGSEYPYAALEYKNAENKTVKVYVQPLNSTTTLEKRTEDIRNGEEIIGQRDVLITSGGELTFAFPENPKSACYNEFINGQPKTDQPENLEVTYNTDYHQYESSLTTTVGSEYEVDIDFIGNGGDPQSGGNENEAKIVFRGIDEIGFDEHTNTATITYKNAQNEDVTVTVAPAQGTTLEKRAEQIYDGETPTDSYRDVLITNGGAVDISFTAEPLSANYNEFINGQPQTEQPVDFEINNNETSLTTVVGSEYEVNLDFAGNGGGGGPQPGGNSTAKINISGMDYNGNPSWTGTPGYGHEKVTTYYDKYWFSTQFAINENGEHGQRTERWDMFSWEDNYTDEQYAEAAQRYGTQVISYDKEDGAETVDISVFLGNWGDRIDAIKINDVDYSNQLHLDGDPTKPNIFDDEASMLRLFKDQGIYITIKDVPVNECEDDGIDDEYNIQIAASPNSNCYIGNFLWSQDDYYAPIEMGGIEPSDKYIGKSTLTLMDIYYQDGTFDPNQEPDSTDGFYHLDDGWYKHIAVDDSVKEYTNEEMPAIHYQLDRRGYNPETHSESGPSNSEMVMPTGTWVKMKIQPEQGYQVKSFSGVNRNAGNVKILSDEADDACIFMFKIDSGNFHIGANVVPYENTADTEESEAVSAASVDLEAGTLDGGTGELSVVDIQINGQDAVPYKEALESDADDYNIEAGLDLSLNEIYLKGGVQDDNADAAWRTEVGNTSEGLNEPAEITLSLDEDIDLSGKDVQIVHKNTHANNGTETRYESVMITGYDPETNAISFEAPSFSDYAILTKEAAVPEGNKAKLRINTTLGVMSNDQATFTYKDGDETVGVVQTSDVVALEAEKDDKDNVVSQFAYTTKEADVEFILVPANKYYKAQVLEDRKWIDLKEVKPVGGESYYKYKLSNYELTPDGTPVTDVQFRFVCTRTYDISFAEPTLTVGEGEETITADVVGIQGFDEALTGGKVAKGTNIAGLGAKDNITLSGFDPERMVVRITAAGTTGWAKVLNPIPVDDNYVVSLGMLDVPEGSTVLEFSLIEKRGDNFGPNGGEDSDEAVLAFPESSQITFNENTSTATVTYINNQGEDVAVTVKPAEGTMLYKRADPIFDDQGTGEQPPEPVGYVDVLVTNGGQLTFEFSEEPLYAGYYMDDDSRDENPRGIDINNKTATFATEKGHAYEVCLDFGGNGGPDPNIAVVRFHGAVDIKKDNSGVVTVTYLDKNDKNVKLTVTAQEGVIDRAGTNVWYDSETDSQVTEYELYSTGGVINITFPKSPEHTLAFWSAVINGVPGDPIDFVFNANNKTTLDTEPGNDYDVDISFVDGPEPPHSDGTIKTNGIYCASNYPSIQAGISIEKSNEEDDVEYRWVACDSNNPLVWFEVSPWKLNNNWMSWTPEKSGSYVFVCYARVVGNEEASEIQSAFGTEYHKAIKAVCQMPYDGGFLVGIESRDNPNNSYKYEMLVLDCNLLVQGDPNPWIYSTGKCGSLDNSLWTLWKPVYGYYWTLFRIYDANDNLIDEVCYGFTNAN